MLGYVIPTDEEHAATAQRTSTRRERSRRLVPRIEPPAEHTVAKYEIELTAPEVIAEIGQRADDVPLRSEGSPSRVDLDGYVFLAAE